MLLTVVLSLISVIIIILSIIIKKYRKISEKVHLITILCGFGLQFLAIISALINSNFISLSIAVFSSDLLLGLPFILLYKIQNEKLLKFADTNGKWIKRICAGTAAVLLFETFICNFGAFNLISPASPKIMNLPLSQASISGGTLNNDILTINSQESASIEFKDINYEVSTIFTDIELSGAAENQINIAYSDETYAEDYRYDANLNYINGNESSKYIICSFSGKVENLQFNINVPENASINLKSISINKDIPFDFSWTRFFIILAGVLFIVVLSCCPIMKKPCGNSKILSVFNTSSAIITVLFMFIAIGLLLVRGDMIYDLFENPDKNQINQELVDAFEAGQVSLLETPSQELLDLKNPYDWSMRNQAGVSYPWDHLLFDGKYYSYYGIGTVLTLFLPYHMITGKYFPSLWATFIYSLIGIIFLTLTYCTFIKRLFPKISNGIAISGLVIVQSASFIWYCITIGNFYELAQISGFTFLIAGMFFLLRSNVFGERKVSRVNIAIATSLFSIAVLCRAALALYCIVSLLFIYAGVKKIVNISDNPTYKANKKPIITFLIAAFLPFILIGSIQMIYNYMRFGSIFDFGIQYTLTIYDYQHIQFHIPLTLIAIFNYLFTLPRVSSAFPFVTSNYDSLSVNGYYFLAGFSSAGIIFRAIPVLGYIFGKRAYKIGGNNKRIAALIIIAGCIVVPLIQMFMIWEYGYTPRYAVDFAWQMILGAFVILFTLHNKISPQMKKVMYTIFMVSAIISVAINFSLTYEFVLDYGNSLNGIPIDIRSSMISFGRLFEFWNII